MIVFDHPLILLLLLPLAAVAVWAWQNAYVNLSRRRKVLALCVRLALLALLVFGLVGVSLRLPSGNQAVVFVADRSASEAAQSTAIQAAVDAAIRHRPANDIAGVVSAGREALVEQPASNLTRFDGFQSTVNADHTNLESGLELAGAIMPSGYRKRVVLLSDGQQNVGDALLAARLLRAEHTRVDVMPEAAVSGPDVLVDRVSVPSQLRSREKFTVGVWLRSNVATTGRLDLFRDRRLVGSRVVLIHAGSTAITFPEGPLSAGTHRFLIHVSPALDSVPQNNTGSGLTQVQGAPRVLVLADALPEAGNVVSGLRSTGIRVDLRKPADVPASLSFLERYAAVLIVDTPAPVLGTDLMTQLVPYVRDLGRGLLVIGGEQSFGVGGYGQTPLEKVLPVKMDLPQRKDIPSAGVVLVLESLEAPLPVNISKEAGKGVVRLLTEQDQVGINDAPSDGSNGWIVPLQNARNKGAILHAIDAMLPGDPGSYAYYLRSAYDSLKQANVKIKHIIVLGDGDAHDAAYASLVKRFHAGGVTVSAIATNVDAPADRQMMQDIARWGGGRFYRADDVRSIPQIFLREATTVARSGIVQGKFYPERLSANPMIRNLHRLPPLYGYVATAPKSTGELVLVSKNLDPILAGWQFGLGRAAAWTSDAAGLWTKNWLATPGANRFWADVVDWTLPSSTGVRLFVNTSISGARGQITVSAPTLLGSDPTLTAHVVDPGLHSETLHLQPTAPGQYGGAFSAATQGSYAIAVEGRGNGHALLGSAGADVPYSAEYRTTGGNQVLLARIAREGGGSIITSPQSAWADNLEQVYTQRSLATWLWLLAVLLLPVDIAIRRLLLTRRDVERVRAALGLLAGGKLGAQGSLRPVEIPMQRIPVSAPRMPQPEREAAQASGVGIRVRTADGDGRVAIGEHDPRNVRPQPDTTNDSAIDRLLAAKRTRG